MSKTYLLTLKAQGNELLQMVLPDDKEETVKLAIEQYGGKNYFSEVLRDWVYDGWSGSYFDKALWMGVTIIVDEVEVLKTNKK